MLLLEEELVLKSGVRIPRGSAFGLYFRRIILQGSNVLLMSDESAAWVGAIPCESALQGSNALLISAESAAWVGAIPCELARE